MFVSRASCAMPRNTVVLSGPGGLDLEVSVMIATQDTLLILKPCATVRMRRCEVSRHYQALLCYTGQHVRRPMLGTPVVSDQVARSAKAVMIVHCPRLCLRQMLKIDMIWPPTLACHLLRHPPRFPKPSLLQLYRPLRQRHDCTGNERGREHPVGSY
jgi:hypothetical protein